MNFQKKISTFTNRRRVVITGLGLISPLGVGVEKNWESLKKKKSGIKLIDRFTEDLPVRAAGLIPAEDFSLTARSRFIEYALIATREALADANWSAKTQEQQEYTGVCIGTSIGGMDFLESNHQAYLLNGTRYISPALIPSILSNSAAGYVSVEHNLQGPNHCVSTACAAGNHSIGDAANFIRQGIAQIMVAGSSEACITPLVIGGFYQARALAKVKDIPIEELSRPFDLHRSGIVLGEGAGIVILEEYEHAIKRGARIYAELRGYGIVGEAYHITAPSPNARGGFRAMKMAVEDAQMHPSEIGYVNAHATSTKIGDIAEAKAINQFFSKETAMEFENFLNNNVDLKSSTIHNNLKSNDDLEFKMPKVSSFKGSLGHCLGAAGSIESVLTIMALYNSTYPPTLNLTHPDPECALNHIFDTTGDHTIKAVLKNSFGFGGTNSSLLFSKLEM